MARNGASRDTRTAPHCLFINAICRQAVHDVPAADHRILWLEELTAHPLSAELKDSLVAKMLPPNNVRVPQLVRETGIPRDTLYGWRRQAVGRGVVAATPARPLGPWSSEEKFAAVIETASLNELELGEYCRRKGLFPEQLSAWRELCRQANAPLPTKAERAQQRAEREQVQRLTRELQRKDRALAEAAALLVLQKKVRAIWEEPADVPFPRSGGSR